MLNLIQLVLLSVKQFCLLLVHFFNFSKVSLGLHWVKSLRVVHVLIRRRKLSPVVRFSRISKVS